MLTTEEIYIQMRGLAEKMGACEGLKISKTTATFSQKGAIKRMGFEAVNAFFNQAPIENLARRLRDGQILKIGPGTVSLVRWGVVQATRYSAIAVRLNRHSKK